MKKKKLTLSIISGIGTVAIATAAGAVTVELVQRDYGLVNDNGSSQPSDGSSQSNSIEADYYHNMYLNNDYVVSGQNVTVNEGNDLVSITKNDGALYDCYSENEESLDGFATTISDNEALSSAEFILTSDGTSDNNYTVYNPFTKMYLTNATDADTVFSSTNENDMLLTESTDDSGKALFQICKSDGTRYIIFDTSTMTFNSNTSYSTSKSNWNYELMLLHKNATTSDDDVIPYYTRASVINSGDTYLITYLWTGGSNDESTDGSIFVLYPENGVINQTKLLAQNVSTIVINAEKTGQCLLTIDNFTYLVTIKTYLKAGYDSVETGTTVSQPFPTGTGGSSDFRIPGLITLSDGKLAATSDARWTTTSDGGGSDTIFSISSDNGDNWSYSFPLYFPDSNGYAGTSATTITDPVITQGEDGTIYLMADVNPTGVTTASGFTYPNEGTGYVQIDGTNRLVLTSDYANVNTLPTADDTSTYQYYVGDFDDNGMAYVYNRSDNSKTNYMVDEWYNIYQLNDDNSLTELTQTQVNSNTTIQQNAFYKDSSLHVYNTGYMWLATSKDEGKTWSNQILNSQIKGESEDILLVSPGRATCLSDGTILIGFYYYDQSEGTDSQQSTFIFSKDNGITWTRVGNISTTNGYSSENETIELPDGTIRMFTRNGQGKIAYCDAKWDDQTSTYVWSNSDGITTTDVSVTSACFVSAITYSKKIDGKNAILVSCPSNGSSRSEGKIYVFLLNDDNSMTLAYTYSVTEGDFSYSCLTELDNGKIGLLYEPGVDSGSIDFVTYDINDIASGATIET